MISRIATVPATPLLIPEIAQGAASELDEIRAASLERVRWAAAPTGRVVVLAAAPGAMAVTAHLLSGELDLSGLGLPVEKHQDASEAPVVSAMVGRWLAMASAVHLEHLWEVPSDPSLVLSGPLPDLIGDDAGIVLIADGSATRTPKAPGSFVEGSLAFDEQLTEAVGDVDVNFFLDPARAGEAERFGAQGLGVWAVAARVIVDSGAEWQGEVDLTADPFGVQYLVAGWSRAS